MNQTQIGQLIRKLGLDTGLPQEQFAVELEVTSPTINRWEDGHSKPSPLAMHKIELKLRRMDSRGKNLLEQCLQEGLTHPDPV